MIKKRYLEELYSFKYDKKRECDNCKRKPQYLYQPNNFIIDDGDKWLVCRQCLDELFTISKKKDKNEKS